MRVNPDSNCRPVLCCQLRIRWNRFCKQ